MKVWSGTSSNLVFGKSIKVLRSMLSRHLGQYSQGTIDIKGGGGRGPNRLDLTVGRFFFLLFGKMSSGWETVEIN